MPDVTFSTRQIGFALLAGVIAYTVIRRTSDGASNTRRATPSCTMPLQEAYLLLGLKAGATRSEVVAVHRNLMKLIHPDRGGTAYLTAKVNEARDVLLQHVKA